MISERASVEPGSRERDEVSDGTEMKIERHWEEKKLMNSLQLQDFS